MVELVDFAASIHSLVPQIALDGQESVRLVFDSYLGCFVLTETIIKEGGCVLVDDGFHLFHNS